MIEIGRDRMLAYGTRAMGDVFFSFGAILVLIWLVRGLLGASQYSQTILIVATAFWFLSRAFRTNISGSVARAVSSFFGNMAFACLTTILAIWVLGWIATLQADTLQAIWASSVPGLAVATIFFALASIVVAQASPRTRQLKTGGPALLLKQASTTDMGETKLLAKSDSVGLPVRKSWRTVGCVITGDLNAVFETPMGTLNATIAGPVTTFGVPFKGGKATGEQIVKVTGKKLSELMEETHVETSDMPVIHARRNGFSVSADRDLLEDDGPCARLMQRIGPVRVDLDEDLGKRDDYYRLRRRGRRERFSFWWSLKGTRDSSYITSTGDLVRAKWNGSSLDFTKNSMRLKVGSDGFEYSPDELETYTPLHALRVTKDKLTLDTKRFTLDVSGKRVVLRMEDGSKSTESEDLARDLRTLLADMAKKQVSDVLQGQPIELDDMLSGTEELLKKYA